MLKDQPHRTKSFDRVHTAPRDNERARVTTSYEFALRCDTGARARVIPRYPRQTETRTTRG